VSLSESGEVAAEILSETQEAWAGERRVTFRVRGRVSETLPLVARRIPEYFDYVEILDKRDASDADEVGKLPGGRGFAIEYLYLVAGPPKTSHARG
jgi:hypothetical protein